MKKILTLYIVMFALGLLGISYTFATVGGPTFVSQIYYHAETNSYKYAEEDNGGRGGVLIKRYDLDDNSEEILTEFAGNYNQDDDGYLFITPEQEQSLLQEGGYLPLQEIDLSKLPVSFDLSLDKMYVINDFSKYPRDEARAPFLFDEDAVEYYMPGDVSKYGWTARVMVNDLLQRKVELTSCRLDAFNFRAYSLPGANFAIVVATAQREDCFEGGYIGERVFPVKYVAISKDLFLGTHSEAAIQDAETYQRKLQHTPGGVFHQTQSADLAKAVNTRGFDYYTKEDYQTALEYFQYAHDQAGETYPLALYNLASTQAKIGKSQDAVHNLQKLITYPEAKQSYCKKIQTDDDFTGLSENTAYQNILQICNGVQKIVLPKEPLSRKIMALVREAAKGDEVLEKKLGQRIAAFLEQKVPSIKDPEFQQRVDRVQKELKQFYL